ncbi:tryptophan synthase subunit alpha [Scardovia inopinata]|uniref:Tryptophan synthase alpha chain n=1 Tax=Scardovia inopinata F0304 TaxID=641146 RepID=W5IGQ7_SCAIO|nr:tryptophan synthase subunit alpha [Scardovia inopinata]EFG26136.1 tryptophan synthase, alpha subunit [Scardovia inopinata F0304]BAR07239.1 tryptophan synthase alpha subunit [Scardovia inopinata JCM 12537]SUV51308.1 tryptophan synthase subunit alpha [Scardovia inopinata]
MNRTDTMAPPISDAFADGKAFIPFITAGDPSLDKTEEFILDLDRAGADLIEVGIPFSDPIAEGPIIQEADIRSLAAGTTTDDVFAAIGHVRSKTTIPLVFMTYLNIVFYYGYDRFFRRCQQVGISGIIIPDLPFEEKNECSSIASRYGVDIISMIAPTSQERIHAIASKARGFIYLVSSLGVTGERSEITTDLRSLIDSIHQTSDLPVAIGFGINTPEQAHQMAELADGVIVGSALVRIIGDHGGDAGPLITTYVQKMKDSLD